MKRTFLLPGFLVLGFAVCVIAQTEAEYSGWMKDIAKTKGKVTKEVAAKQNTEVATDAEHLASDFKQVGSYLTSKNMSDAANMAKNAEKASDDLASAAKASDAGKMESSLQTLNMSCGECHMAHRGGSPGSYTIK